MSRSNSLLFSALLCAATQACVLAPRGLDAERDRLDESGRDFHEPFEERTLPELPPEPTWSDVLERAFLANGELEAAWFEWAAALERVTIAAGWPNTNLAPSFSYLLSGGGMKAWDRTTVSIGFDAMQNLSLPNKVRKAGEVAFADAAAAGRRFAQAKFRLQRAVLERFLDLCLIEEEVRIARELLVVAKLSSDTATGRVQAGGGGRELLRAQVESARIEDEVARLEARARAQRTVLNGMLARAAEAPLAIAPALPTPRPLAVDDAALIAAGVDENPELQALAFEVEGRADALELARLQYLPDFNPFFSFTGSVEQAVGVGVMLPTTLPQIRAGVEAARAMLREAQAMSRQAQYDRRASYVAALVALRDSERQAAWFETTVLPAAEQALASTRPAFAAGSATLVELLDAQSSLLDVRRTLAMARIEREKRLAEIEELAGLDLETLSASTPGDFAHRSTDSHE